MADDIVKVIADTRTDAASLQVVVNGDEDTQVTTRLGESYPTVKKAIKLMTQAGVGFTSFETKALMTASSLANGTYAIVTNDTAVNNGLHLKKSGAWSKVTYDVDERQKEYTSGEIKKLDSLIVNEGKRYPLAQRDRQGASVGPSVPFMDALLDASITNARPNNYYHISYYANGDDTLSPDGNGWLIRRIPIDSYPDGNDSANVIVAYSDAQRQPIGIDTIVIQSKTEEVVSITLDATKLPPRGQSINAGAQGMDGYEYVISPDCYIYTTNSDEDVQQLSATVSDNLIASQSYANDAKTQAVAIATDVAADDATTKANDAKNAANTFTNNTVGALDALKINSGKTYPFKVLTRNNISKPVNAAFANAILDVKVLNAEKDFYYNIEYYTNGDIALEPSGEGWRVSKVDIATYANSDVRQVLVNYIEPQRKLIPGIDTIVLRTITDEVVVITLDTTKLPSYGTPIRAVQTTHDGYSSIIDPSCYFYTTNLNNRVGDLTNTLADLEATVQSLPSTISNMYAKLSAGLLAVDYASGNKRYRLNFAPNGYNNLPNIVGWDFKNSGGEWTQINTASTDWLPPLAIVATDGDGGPFIYTGGNHGADGSSGGGQTARNVYYDIKIDGLSKTSFDAGCNTVEINIINELMASNTITLNRYVLRQAFKVLITDGVLTVTCQHTALEPITVKTDNGLQSVTTGFNDTYLMLDSQYQERRSWDVFTSGPKSLHPNAWAIITQSTSGHQLTSWMDLNYEAGDGRYVASTSNIIRRNEGAGSSKVYHCVIKGNNAVLAKGESYKWRGGYQAKAVSEKPQTADSQFSAINERVIVYNAIDYMTV